VVIEVEEKQKARKTVRGRLSWVTTQEVLDANRARPSSVRRRVVHAGGGDHSPAVGWPRAEPLLTVT
jgi:hypothetical protein